MIDPTPDWPHIGRTPRVGGTSPGDIVSAPRPGEREDLLEALALAFRENPMNVAIHGPDPAQRVRANRAGLRALVLRAGPGAEVRVARMDGRTAGGFVVVNPGCFPLSRMGLRDQIGCLFHQGWAAVKKWDLVNQTLLMSHPTHPHWYLAVLGVAPWASRRGLGRALVEELGRLVGREPAPIYLESDRPESVAFYRQLGFETRNRTRILGVDCVSLERPPDPDGF